MLELMMADIKVGILIAGVIIAVKLFMVSNHKEHSKMMAGLDKIVNDCVNSNKQCREELRKANKEFVSTLKQLLNGHKHGR